MHDAGAFCTTLDICLAEATPTAARPFRLYALKSYKPESYPQ
jgi:hypothetical protein